MLAADFALLLAAARAHGVSQFKCGDVEVTFGYIEQPPERPRPSAPTPPDDRYVDPAEAARMVGAVATPDSVLEAKIRELRAAEADMFPVIGDGA